MQLVTCESCPGLIPPNASTCPHCNAAVNTRSGPLRRLLQVATGGAIAMTLMACYGQPPCEDDNCGEGGYGGDGGSGGQTTTGGTGGQATTGGAGGQATTGGAGGQATTGGAGGQAVGGSGGAGGR